MILSRLKTLTCALAFSNPEAVFPHMSLVLITVAWPFSPKLFSQGRAIRSKVRLPSAGTQYLPHAISQSKTVLMNLSGFQAVDSTFQVAILSGIPGSFGCIPDLKAQGSVSTSKNFSYSGIRLTLHRATRQRKKIPVFFSF